jgi:hypothetical protein
LYSNFFVFYFSFLVNSGTLFGKRILSFRFFLGFKGAKAWQGKYIEGISVLTFSSSLMLALFIMSFPHFGQKQKFFSKENPQLEQNFALD